MSASPRPARRCSREVGGWSRRFAALITVAIKGRQPTHTSDTRKAFERWMIEVAKITIGSEDPHTAELESEEWRVWPAAWQAARS